MSGVWPSGQAAWDKLAASITARNPAAAKNWKQHRYNVQMNEPPPPLDEQPMQPNEEETLF